MCYHIIFSIMLRTPLQNYNWDIVVISPCHVLYKEPCNLTIRNAIPVITLTPLPSIPLSNLLQNWVKSILHNNFFYLQSCSMLSNSQNGGWGRKPSNDRYFSVLNSMLGK